MQSPHLCQVLVLIGASARRIFYDSSLFSLCCFLIQQLRIDYKRLELPYFVRKFLLFGVTVLHRAVLKLALTGDARALTYTCVPVVCASKMESASRGNRPHSCITPSLRLSDIYASSVVASSARYACCNACSI